MDRNKDAQKKPSGAGERFLTLVMVLGMFSVTCINTYELRMLENRLETLESSTLVKPDDKQEAREKFQQSEYYKNHLMDTRQPKETLLANDSDRYILVTADSCSHCRDLEALLYEDETLQLDNLYIYDDSQAGTLQWDTTGKEVESYYEETVDEFNLRGTPTLIHIAPGKDKLEVVMGTGNIEDVLREAA